MEKSRALTMEFSLPLRTALAGSLLDKDGKKILESDGAKRYRLSVHPDFLICDKQKLSDHPDHRVVNLVKKWPRGKE